MKIRLAGVNNMSLVNGEGCRLVIFVQGCKHYCDGCQNPDTWDFDGGYEMDVLDLANSVKDILARHPLDGITLSGGDPFYQQEACAELIRALPPANVWCYTGYEYDNIKNTELAKLCDVIVDGPYVQELKCEGKLYGSSNQRIIRKGKEV